MNLIALLKGLLAWLLPTEDAPTRVTPTPAPQVPLPDETTKPPISPAALRFILAGHTQGEQEDLKRQIAEHEAAGEVEYTLWHGEGGYYKIDHGQIRGSGSGGRK